MHLKLLPSLNKNSTIYIISNVPGKKINTDYSMEEEDRQMSHRNEMADESNEQFAISDIYFFLCHLMAFSIRRESNVILTIELI